MSKTTQIFIDTEDQIPAIETIRSISRQETLKLIFRPVIQNQREAIGEQLRARLHGFQVGIHMTKPEINIVKLITDEEIELHQDFFEKCAKDYRELSKKLIYKVAEKLELNIDPQFPLLTFNPLKRDTRQKGSVDGWNYYLHGFHCGFVNRKTGQLIETPLVFGLEFGELDPYFFTKYIKSTPAYRPLPIEIYDNYADGVRINEKMLALGKFERIPSNIENNVGVVVTDRDKVEVSIYREEKQKVEKQKVSLLRFLGFK